MNETTRETVRLEEYKLVIDILRHIFWEFWTGNDFFMSFFAAVTLALIVNPSVGGGIQWIVKAVVFVAIMVIVFVWMVTNFKHSHFTSLYMRHARELEEHLGTSIFTRRTANTVGLAKISVRKVWAFVPLVFLIIDSVLIFAGER